MTYEQPLSASQASERYRGLQSLEILNFRNIQSAQLAFTHGLNLIRGHNASGKTSLLEAIYTLGRVRSFRTHSARETIRYGQPAFRLVGRITGAAGHSVPVGIERGSESLQVHLGGEPIRRLSDLAGFFPVQILSSDTSTLFNGGPRYRRHVLDWALFHVEQGYREVWQRYSRILKQRNAALRSRARPALITVWDAELVEAAATIDRLRRAYLDRFSVLLAEELRSLLPDSTPELIYSSGWPAATTLSEALGTALEKDRGQGYTRHGVHRADFRLLIDERDVTTHCSRGQQKSVLVGFMLAQVRLQQERACPAGAFLLDDLTSELDQSNQQRVLQALRELDAQVFVTAITGEPVETAGWDEYREFHVEHGAIQEVL
ncbi:MAG: DNA replication/repair protein RecF [Gammaproteobacteria bacterium]